MNLAPEKWTLAWNDEFSGPKINTSNWLFQALPPGAFNNEIQRYVGDAEAAGTAVVKDGSLVITAKRSGSEIISARLNSRYNFTFGMVEVAMKVPYEQAIWPAFWLLGLGEDAIWPGCGEMDVLEVFGHVYGKEVSSTVHDQAHHFPISNPLTPGRKELSGLQPIASDEEWHTWRLFWSPRRVSMTLDAHAARVM